MKNLSIDSQMKSAHIDQDYSTVQYITVQYRTVQCSTTVQYSTVQYSTVQYSTVPTMDQDFEYQTQNNYLTFLFFSSILICL